MTERVTVGMITAATCTNIRIDLDKIANDGMVIRCKGEEYRLSPKRIRMLLRLFGKKVDA